MQFLLNNSEQAVEVALARLPAIKEKLSLVVGRETLKGPKQNRSNFNYGFKIALDSLPAIGHPTYYLGDQVYEFNFAKDLDAKPTGFTLTVYPFIMTSNAKPSQDGEQESSTQSLPDAALSTQPKDVADALRRISETIEKRRLSGDYPEGLEDQLDRHYRQILKGFDVDDTEMQSLQGALHHLRSTANFNASHIESWSPNPLKRLLHRLFAKLTVRQTRGVLLQIEQYTDALDNLLSQMIENTQEATSAEQGQGLFNNRSDLERRLSTALDRLNLLEEKFNNNQTL